MLIHNAIITGSLSVNGTGYNTGSFSGSFIGAVAGTTATASYVEYSDVANKPALVSGSSQITYSGLTGIPSGIVSGSAQISDFGIFATTGSNGFNGNQSITGSLTVTGQVVAQTLNVQQVTSSIVYSSGSNVFGNSISNTQQFTGSLQVSGSSHYVLGNVGIGATSPSYRLDVNGPSGNIARITDGTNHFIFYAGSGLNEIATTSPLLLTVAGSERLRITSNGNLGLGITPSAWGSTNKVFETTAGTLMLGRSDFSAWGRNFYYNSADAGIYTGNGHATGYLQTSGQHQWITAPSGTAGNAISFTQAMTLTSGGNLLVGTTSDNGARLQVSGNTTIAGSILSTSAGTERYFQMLGYNSSYVTFRSNVGFSSSYNNFSILLNVNSNESGQGNSSLPSWAINLGGNEATADTFAIARTPAGSYSFSNLFILASTGAANFSSNVTAGGSITSSTANYPQIIFQETTTSTNSLIFYDNVGSPKSLRFRVNGATNLMSINENGNVGIGTSSPGGKLTVSGAGVEAHINNGDTNTLTLGNFSSGRHFIKSINLGVALTPLTLQASSFTFDTGNVGIGTTSPSSLLDVQGPSGASGSTLFTIQKAGGWGATEFFQYYNSSSDYGINFGLAVSNATNGRAGIIIRSDTSGNGTLVFNTTSSERMRITSGGVLKARGSESTYHNINASYHELRTGTGGQFATAISNTGNSPFGLLIDYNSAPNNSTSEFLYCTDGIVSTLRAAIRSNGGLSNFQANNTNLSDERTKKDIEPLESYWDKFKEIEIVKFKYKDQTHDDFNIGVIAQQVEAVAPEFVDIDGWDTKPELDEEGNEIVSTEEPLKSIYTADLYHATIKVLQEAMVKIETLEAEIQLLKQQ